MKQIKKQIGKRVLSFFAACCLTVGFLVLPSSKSLASYNDAVYDSYKNMNAPDSSGAARYIVPNLYRQDAAYANVKTFPLVVSEGVEYVPLDIFALFSYLEVVYGRISYSFYINNTRNGHYIAFDIDNGTTTTDSGETLDIESKLFYRTYYVPAKAVCDVLRINFESYDNPEDGIRAARISDSKAKYTLYELVKMYSPVKNESTNDPDDKNDDPVNNPDDTPDNSGKDDPVVPSDDPDNAGKNTETDTPKPPDDPYKNVAARYLYLTFDNLPNGNTDSVLGALRKESIKASFFVTQEALLAHPDTVRRMIADGHTVGLYISPADGKNVLSNEELCARITEAEETLKLVTKSTARLLRLVPGYTRALEENGFFAYAAEQGYRFYHYTLDAGDGAGRAQNVFTSLCSALVGNNEKTVRTLHVRFGSHAITADVVTRLIEFCEKYPQFRIVSFDETVGLP